MKKVNIVVFQLAAAIVALAGSVVNVVGLFVELPAWISIISAVVLLLASGAWLTMYLLNTKKK